MGAIPQIIVLDNVFDAQESLLVRFDVFHELVEVPMCLTPAAVDLVVVVSVGWYQVDNDLVGNHVFPICASRYAAVQHRLGLGEVPSGLLEQMANLDMVSDYRIQREPCRSTEWCLNDSAVSVAEAIISEMGGYGAPGPSPSLQPSAPTPWAPLV